MNNILYYTTKRIIEYFYFIFLLFIIFVASFGAVNISPLIIMLNVK